MKDILLTNRRLMAIFIAAWSIYLFYPFNLSEPSMTADGVTYVHIAKNIVQDGSPGWQATWTSPFFPLLMATLYPLTGNFAVAGMIVSKIMTILLPIAVYLLSSEIFGNRTGIFAAILTAFHPHFIFISGMLEPEITYTTLQVFSLWAIWRALTIEDRNAGNRYRKFAWAAIAGTLASLAYQTRSEVLLIFIFAILAVSLSGFFQRPANNTHLLSHPDADISETQASGFNKRNFYPPRIIITIVIILSFILTSLPYLIFLKDTYGKWVLSSKSSYVQIWMKSRIYHDNNLGELGNPDLWGLSKNGKLMWQEPKGVGELIRYLASDPKKSLRVYIDNFSRQIPGRIPNNSGQWLYPQVYPWYFVIPAFFYLLFSIRRRIDPDKTFFLLSPFLILIILPVFSDGWWKYLLPYSPFLIILSTAGILDIAERLRWRHLVPLFAVTIIVYSIWTVKASPLVKHGNIDITRRISMAEEQKKAGEWAQARFKGTPNYMIQWSKLAYYLNGRWTAMPVSDYYGMVWYARKNKVDYMVFETNGKMESEEIVRVMGNTPELEVADMYESVTVPYGVVFLRLKK